MVEIKPTDNPGTVHEQREYAFKGLCVSGFAMLFFTFVLIPVIIIFVLMQWSDSSPVAAFLISGVCFVLFILGCIGYFTQEPNEARVMIFFGKYKGTCRQTGYYWVNPFVSRKKLSLRIRNMDIEPIKVNDKVGNAALEKFVRIQSDAALREVTGHFAYDHIDGNEEEVTLRDGGDYINELLEKKINERLAIAGMEVVEARLNYLAYAPEIAAVMLRRQQASAIISARRCREHGEDGYRPHRKRQCR